MEKNTDHNRSVIRVTSLLDEDADQLPIGKDPAERLRMVWRITQDCWAFVPGYDAKREFQRHVTRVERRRS